MNNYYLNEALAAQLGDALSVVDVGSVHTQINTQFGDSIYHHDGQDAYFKDNTWFYDNADYRCATSVGTLHFDSGDDHPLDGLDLVRLTIGHEMNVDLESSEEQYEYTDGAFTWACLRPSEARDLAALLEQYADEVEG